MSRLVGAIYLLNDSLIRVFINPLTLNAVITNNAEKHAEGYLIDSSLLDLLYQYKIIEYLKEDSEGELDALEFIISLIESRPFTTFLYKESKVNEF